VRIFTMIYTTTDLCKAVLKGNEELLEAILPSFKEQINTLKYLGVPLLMLAGINNNLKVCELLLQNGANPNLPAGFSGFTIFHVLSAKPNPLILDLLLEKKADPALETDEGATAFHLVSASTAFTIAEQKDVTDTVRVFKNHDVSMDQASTKTKRTPLHMASLYGVHWLVKQLLDFGANPNLADVTGNKAIHWAAISGSAETLNLVMEKLSPEEIVSPNNAGLTPLALAVASGSVEAAEAIIQKIKQLKDLNLKDAINAQDDNGNTPRHFVIISGSSKMEALLISNGATREHNKERQLPIPLKDEKRSTFSKLFSKDKNTSLRDLVIVQLRKQPSSTISALQETWSNHSSDPVTAKLYEDIENAIGTYLHWGNKGQNTDEKNAQITKQIMELLGTDIMTGLVTEHTQLNTKTSKLDGDSLIELIDATKELAGRIEDTQLGKHMKSGMDILTKTLNSDDPLKNFNLANFLSGESSTDPLAATEKLFKTETDLKFTPLDKSIDPLVAIERRLETETDPTFIHSLKLAKNHFEQTALLLELKALEEEVDALIAEGIALDTEGNELTAEVTALIAENPAIGELANEVHQLKSEIGLLSKKSKSLVEKLPDLSLPDASRTSSENEIVTEFCALMEKQGVLQSQLDEKEKTFKEISPRVIALQSRAKEIWKIEQARNKRIGEIREKNLSLKEQYQELIKEHEQSNSSAYNPPAIKTM